MKLIFALPLAIALALAPRIWWLAVGLPRFRKRCDHYMAHINYAAAAGDTRCQCVACVAFRREMGWAP